MKKILNIGRDIKNHLVIKHPSISKNHCRIEQISQNEFIIEDLNSTNGTFVNKKRIKQTKIKSRDKLKLAEFQIETELVLSLFGQEAFQTGVLYEDVLKQDKIIRDFDNLGRIYEDYQNKKRRILKFSTLKSTGLRAGLSFIPVVGIALGILSTGLSANVQEKLIDLEEDFKRKYICPGCFKFLGPEPFENLKKRGYCLICKTKWSK